MWFRLQPETHTDDTTANRTVTQPTNLTRCPPRRTDEYARMNGATGRTVQTGAGGQSSRRGYERSLEGKL